MLCRIEFSDSNLKRRICKKRPNYPIVFITTCPCWRLPAASKRRKRPKKSPPSKRPGLQQSRRNQQKILPPRSSSRPVVGPGAFNDGRHGTRPLIRTQKIESEMGAEIIYVETEQSRRFCKSAARLRLSGLPVHPRPWQMNTRIQPSAVAPDYPDTFFFLSSSRFYDPKCRTS